MSINNNVVSLFLTNILILFISEIWITETSVNVRNKIMLDMLVAHWIYGADDGGHMIHRTT